MSFKLTEKRKRLLSVLQNHPGALSAAEIHALLPGVDLVTVYRNLDLFSTEKLIKQLHFGSDEVRYEYQKEPHHHAICTKCEHVVHFTASDEKIKKLLHVSNFTIEDIEVTVRGTCTHRNKTKK